MKNSNSNPKTKAKKQVIFSHGDKGGSGKSMISAIVVDYFLTKNKDVMLIESDGMIPDVARRYDGLVDVGNANLGGDDAIEVVAKLVELFEKSEAETIIINLPASASETLDPLAQDFIGPALNEIDVDVTVLFAMAKTRDSSTLALASMQDGLASIAKNKIAVMNGYFGDPAQFDWAESQERIEWFENGGKEVLLPRLHDRLMKVAVKGQFSVLAGKDGGQTIANRMLMKRWVNEAFMIGDAIIEG